MVMPSRKDLHPVLLRVLSEHPSGIETVAVYPLVTREFPELRSEDLERMTNEAPSSGKTGSDLQGKT